MSITGIAYQRILRDTLANPVDDTMVVQSHSRCHISATKNLWLPLNRKSISMTDSSSQSEPTGSPAAAGRRSGLFDSTPWSEVLAAGDEQHENNRQSLERLCVLYWPPLHKYVRRKIRDEHLAQDLTQSFFERLLTGRSLRLADPARGRFRSFLVQAFEWHLSNEFREGRAIKRGGDIRIIPLDFSSGGFDVADDVSLSAEQVFDREWALTVLSQTMNRLEEEQTNADRMPLFNVLKSFLTGGAQTEGYAEVGKVLGMNEAAVRMAVSRLRTRYRELLREEILKTVASSQDVDDEIRHLFLAISAR